MSAQQSETKNEKDKYENRKQRLKNAITALLTEYGLDHISEDYLDQKKNELIAEFGNISRMYSLPLEQEISSDIDELQNEYETEKMNIKNQGQEFQRFTQLQPVFLQQRQRYTMDEDMMPEIVPLAQEEIVYARPEFPRMRPIQPSTIPQLAQEAQEEWVQTPGSARQWVERSGSNMVPSESNSSVPRTELFAQAPQFETAQVAAPKIIYSVQTAEQKKLMRDKINQIHAPLIVQQLYARGHRGIIPKSLVEKLLKQQTMEQFSPDDLLYLQGIVQTNFLF
jgi:uncharacterized protein YcgL (UPF0745 family)